MFYIMVEWLEQHLFTCSIKEHFGIDCPGCGSQRALIALLKGNVLDSLHYHVALIPFIITIFALILQLILKKENGAKWVMWLFIVTTALTFIQFFIRQLHFFGVL